MDKTTPNVRTTPASKLRMRSMRFRWARIDPELPGGIHEPKHEGDCGWDLGAMYSHALSPSEAIDIEINVRLEMPPGYWASIEARSSIVKRGLQIDAGIIDGGYRGPLFAVCRNVGGQQVQIQAEERVAQLIFHKLNEVWGEEVGAINVDGTSRGTGGFGSTGT